MNLNLKILNFFKINKNWFKKQLLLSLKLQI